MRDPVLASDGHTYERKSIEEWFETCNKNGMSGMVKSPMSGSVFSNETLVPNISLRKAIHDILERNPYLSEQLKEEEQRTAALYASDLAKSNVLGPEEKSSGKFFSTPELKPAAADPKGAAGGTSSEGSAGAGKAFVTSTPVIASVSEAFSNSPDMLFSTGATKTGIRSEGVMFQWSNVPTEHLYSYRPEEISQVDGAHEDQITCAAHVVQPTGLTTYKAVIATGSRDNLVKIWQRELPRKGGERDTGGPWKITQTLPGHRDWVNCVRGLSAAAVGDHLTPIFVSGSRDHSLRLWKTKSGGEAGWECAAVFEGGETGDEGKGHRDFVNCCDLKGREGSVWLASGSSDWNINLWDINRPEDPLQQLEGHSYAVRCLSWSEPRIFQETKLAGTTLLASGSDDETVRIWDPRAKFGGKVKTLYCGSPVLSVCWGGVGGSATGSWLTAGGGIPLDSMAGSSENIGGWIRVFDIRTWRVVGDCSDRKDSDERTFYSSQYETELAAYYRRGGDGHLPSVKEPEYLTKANRMWEGEYRSRKAARVAEGDQNYKRLAHRGYVTDTIPLRLDTGVDGLASSGQFKGIKLWGIDVNHKPHIRQLGCYSDAHESTITSLMSLKQGF